MSEILDTLKASVLPVVEEFALKVDQEACFPRESVQAMRDAGLLGLLSATEVGGLGKGLREAVQVVETLATACGSTAMVVCMHYCGVSVLEAYGSEEVRKAVAAGQHLSTLAFSEAGSRSHFWAPLSTATQEGDEVQINAKKSWITSANEATAYVWSTQPVSAEGPSTLWLVPQGSEGLTTHGPFDGLGLRGNDSTPVTAEGVKLPTSAMLGPDGAGFDIMMGVVLPHFNLMNGACSLGLMEAGTTRSAKHASGVSYQHLSSSLNDLPTIRAYLARMRCKTDMVRTLLYDAVSAIEQGREDAQLRVLEAKACAGETATEVLDTGMRVCGGAAFRKDVGVERYFRDARAGGVMAPTVDVLYDFIGKAITGMPLF